MVTLVGTQRDYIKALQDLLELEYDSLEAYTAAIDRLENESYKNKLANFKSDHERHIREITQILKNHDIKVKSGPSGKQILLIGGIAISSLISDKAILKAMLNAEEDTVTAYERMSKHDDIASDTVETIKAGLHDEKSHRDWIKQAIEN